MENFCNEIVEKNDGKRVVLFVQSTLKLIYKRIQNCKCKLETGHLYVNLSSPFFFFCSTVLSVLET